MNALRKRYCIYGCDRLVERCVPLHQFPHPERRSELFAAWVLNVGDKLFQTDHMKIYKNKKICDQHFESTQKLSCNRLVPSAIPTINLECMRQSIATIVDTDHNYCRPRREWEQLPSMTSSTVESTVYPIQSASTSTTANTGEGTAKEENVMNENTTVAINDPCDDSDNDDVVPNTPVPESEELPQELFSWDKTDTIVADDTMVVLSDLILEAPELTTLDFGDVSMYNDEQPSKDDHIGNQCSDYTCNQCGETITGFRYTCVQCADWDLCAACEARAAHDTHYVLRVPGQRPYKEVQAILTAVRQHVLSENMFLTEMTTSIKEELIDEEAEVPKGAPETEGDPLGAWNFNHHDDDCDTLENNPDPNEDGRPPRNRRTSLDFLANTQNFTPRDDSSNLVTITDDDLMETNKDGTRSDHGQTCNARFDYSDPIEIIDIDKITKIHEHTKQNSDQNNSDIDTDIIQIAEENDIEIPEGRLDNSLDTYKPKLQHTVQQKLVDTSSFKTALILNDGTHNERIRTQSKEIGTDAKGIREHKRISKKKIGPHIKRIVLDSEANTDDKTKKRYKILLPPGAHWKELLITMLKSRVTVQLVDVMQIIRKMRMHKKTEIKEI